MSLKEKYRSVLEVLRTEDSLQDDTYLAQFLDATTRVINTRQDLAEYGLEEFLGQNITKIREDGFSAELNVNFILQLSRTLLQSCPGLAQELLRSLPQPAPLDSLPQETVLSLLQLYSQVFTNRSDVLPIVSQLSQDNLFWERVLLPVLLRSGSYNNYLNKEIIQCFAEYVAFSLEASRHNQSPKGCEIRNQLESNLKQLIRVKMDGPATDGAIFDIFQRVIEKIRHLQPELNYISEILRDNINFDIVSRTEQYLASPSMLYCYIAVQTSEENQEKLTDYLTFLILSPQHTMKCKKSVIQNVVKSAGLKEILYLVFDQFLEKLTPELGELARYTISVLIRNETIWSRHPQLREKMNAVLLRQLQLFSEISDYVTDKAMRGLCEIARVYLKTVPSDSVTDDILQTLVNIAALRMNVDDFIRSSCLGVVSSLLPSLSSLAKSSDHLQVFCSLALDPSTEVGVRDSALGCVGALVSNPALTVTEEDRSLILLVVNKILASNSGQLKASAINVVTALLSSRRAQAEMSLLERIFPAEDIGGLELCDLFSDEERLALVSLASCLVAGEEPEEKVRERIVEFMIKTVGCDTNWDVKCETLQFWRVLHSTAQARHGSEPARMMKVLERFQFFTGLMLGYHDYEESVRSKYFSFIQSCHNLDTQAGAEIGPGDPSSHTRHVATSHSDITQTDTVMESEEEINRILDVSDKKLVETLTVRAKETAVTNTKASDSDRVRPSWSYEKFKLSLKNIRDPNTEVSPEADLQSILEDILQSCSEDSQLDLIDCY